MSAVFQFLCRCLVVQTLFCVFHTFSERNTTIATAASFPQLATMCCEFALPIDSSDLVGTAAAAVATAAQRQNYSRHLQSCLSTATSTTTTGTVVGDINSDSSSKSSSKRKKRPVEPEQSINRSSVAILTFAAAGSRRGSFAIADIADFAPLQQAVVAAYAETNGYFFHIVSDPLSEVSSGSSQQKHQHQQQQQRAGSEQNISKCDSSNSNNYYSNNSSSSRDQLLLDEFGTLDHRWYKVQLLLRALHPQSGWARDRDFILWLDADAVVLDFNLRVESLAAAFPSSHLIASADVRMGLINSGVLLLRNSKWTREFLSRWWTIADRNRSCDQDAFDALYAQLLREEEAAEEETAATVATVATAAITTVAASAAISTAMKVSVRERVKVLPMDVLNSHPPAMLHQRHSSQVLHLMGESTALRTAAFAIAFNRICAAQNHTYIAAATSSVASTATVDRDAVAGLDHQLGLTRDTLLQLARQIYGADLRAAISRADEATTAMFPIGETALAAARQLQQQHQLVTETATSVKEATGATTAVVVTAEALYEDLEELSRLAHHYCDAMTELHRNSSSSGSNSGIGSSSSGIGSGMEKGSIYIDEVRQLRGDLVSLVSTRIAALENRINATEVALRQLWEQHTTIAAVAATPTGSSSKSSSSSNSNGDSTAAEAVDLESLSQLLERDSAALVMLLKRKAESGNDVFMVAATAQQKIAVAREMEQLLLQLLHLVAEESKHVPLHMLALLYQNLGAVHYSISNAQASQYLQRSHLREARKLLNASVVIFNDHFSTTSSSDSGSGSSNTTTSTTATSSVTTSDSSTLLEMSSSWQLLAAVTCSGLRQQQRGQQQWERAVDQARSALRGMQLGVLYDNFAVVLYNAAVCYSSSSSSSSSSEDGDGDSGTSSNSNSSKLKALHRSLALLQEATAVMRSSGKSTATTATTATHNQSSSSDSSSSSGDDANSLFRLAIELTDNVQRSIHELEAKAAAAATIASVTAVAAEVLMVPAATDGALHSGRTLYRAATSTSTSTAATSAVASAIEEEEDDLWEECDLDEDCESFDVLVAATDADADTDVTEKESTAATAIEEAIAAEEASAIAVTEDEAAAAAEEAAELAETRARYAKQAARFAAHWNPPPPPQQQQQQLKHTGSSSSSSMASSDSRNGAIAATAATAVDGGQRVQQLEHAVKQLTLELRELRLQHTILSEKIRNTDEALMQQQQMCGSC